MIVNNITGKLFGKQFVFIAYIFIVSGILMISNKSYIQGIVTIFIFMFVVFTKQGIEINTETHQIKQFTKIYGLLKIGTWQNLDKYLGFTLVPFIIVKNFFSLSNRKTTEVQHEYRVFLVNKSKKPELLIKKCKTEIQGHDSINEFSIWLKLPVYSVKK